MIKFAEFVANVKTDARLTDLINRYDDNPNSLTDEELDEMCNRANVAYGEDVFGEEDPDYDWGYNEDEGFDPYMGEYTWDC